MKNKVGVSHYIFETDLEKIFPPKKANLKMQTKKPTRKVKNPWRDF